jgi:hypothetical protein
MAKKYKNSAAGTDGWLNWLSQTNSNLFIHAKRSPPEVGLNYTDNSYFR